MCLITIAYRVHPKYKFVLVANRDEFWERPTSSAHWWEDQPHLLAGRDLVAMGTWLGITQTGRFAAVTNYREPSRYAPDAISRGHLTSKFLSEHIHPKPYLRNIEPIQHQYNGFNLLIGTLSELYYCSNRIPSHKPFFRPLPPGIYGLSNHLLDTPWPKVVKAKQLLEHQLKQDILAPETLVDMLLDTTETSDDHLPHTGVETWLERKLSPLFIEIPSTKYGTRLTSVLLIDQNHQVQFYEKSWKLNTVKSFHFQAQPFIYQTV